MLEREKCSELTIDGKTYPYICDLLVMEEIQKDFGDLVDYENGIRGIVPYYAKAGEVIKRKGEDGTTEEYIADEGERVFEKDGTTVPDITMVCKSLHYMLVEGAEITGSDPEDVPTEKDLKRQMDYPIYELALIVFKEWQKNFFQRKTKQTKKRTSTKRQSTKTQS